MEGKTLAKSLSPKVAGVAAEALAFFQRGDVDAGAARLSRAYALHRKTSPSRTPLINVVAYLGLLNDLPENPSSDWNAAHRLVMKHTGVCGVLEEWAFNRPSMGRTSSAEYHAACRRFCADVPLSEEMRGDQDQIGLVAAILMEHGAALESPSAAMSAIEECLSAVSEISPPPQRGSVQPTPPPSQGSVPTVPQASPARSASR